MNQTATTKTTASNTHPVDLEALRLQLKQDGEVYSYNRNPEEDREQLLHTLQANDCRDICTAAVDVDDLASVFVFAACRDHVDILEAFLHHGMYVDIKDQDGRTALMEASCYGHEECVRLLLAHNANVDVQNNNGDTALMLSSENGHTKTVEILLEKNADLDLHDNSGMTALMFASVRAHKHIVQVLLNHGADIELKRCDGKTALDLADDDEIKETIQNHVTASYLLK